MGKISGEGGSRAASPENSDEVGESTEKDSVSKPISLLYKKIKCGHGCMRKAGQIDGIAWGLERGFKWLTTSKHLQRNKGREGKFSLVSGRNDVIENGG